MIEGILLRNGHFGVDAGPENLRLFGGASRDRTDDLIVANDALSQLSYSPTRVGNKGSAGDHETRSRPHYTKNTGRMKYATTRDNSRHSAAHLLLLGRRSFTKP